MQCIQTCTHEGKCMQKHLKKHLNKHQNSAAKYDEQEPHQGPHDDSLLQTFIAVFVLLLSFLIWPHAHAQSTQSNCQSNSQSKLWLERQEIETYGQPEEATDLRIKSIRSTAELHHACTLKQLKRVVVHSDEFGPAELLTLAVALESSNRIGHITDLAFESSRLNTLNATSGNEGLRQFRKLEKLLIRAPLTEIAPDSLPTSLESLQLDSRVKGKRPMQIDLSGIAALPNLSRLGLTGFQPKDFAPLHNASRITRLTLDNVSLTDESFSQLAKSKLGQSVVTLQVSNNQIQDGGILKDFKNLEFVRGLYLNPLTSCDADPLNMIHTYACGFAALWSSKKLNIDRILSTALKMNEDDLADVIESWVSDAFQLKRHDILKPLKTARGPSIYSQRIGHASYFGSIDELRIMLNDGADPNETNFAQARGGRTTPLSLALTGLHLDAIRLLLEKGAQVDKPDSKGQIFKDKLKDYETLYSNERTLVETGDSFLTNNPQCDHQESPRGGTISIVNCKFNIPLRIATIRELLTRHEKTKTNARK